MVFRIGVKYNFPFDSDSLGLVCTLASLSTSIIQHFDIGINNSKFIFSTLTILIFIFNFLLDKLSMLYNCEFEGILVIRDKFGHRVLIAFGISRV